MVIPCTLRSLFSANSFCCPNCLAFISNALPYFSICCLCCSVISQIPALVGAAYMSIADFTRQSFDQCLRVFISLTQCFQITNKAAYFTYLGRIEGKSICSHCMGDRMFGNFVKLPGIMNSEFELLGRSSVRYVASVNP